MNILKQVAQAILDLEHDESLQVSDWVKVRREHNDHVRVSYRILFSNESGDGGYAKVASTPEAAARLALGVTQ